MTDHYKKHLVYGMRSTNQFKKTLLQLMKLFEYEGQGHQMCSSKCGKTGIFTCLVQYLERYIKENKKTSGLCTKYMTTVNKMFIKNLQNWGENFRFIVHNQGNGDYLILSNFSRK